MHHTCLLVSLRIQLHINAFDRNNDRLPSGFQHILQYIIQLRLEYNLRLCVTNVIVFIQLCSRLFYNLNTYLIIFFLLQVCLNGQCIALASFG